jgi:long-chain acyl-CoA synthetase
VADAGVVPAPVRAPRTYPDAPLDAVLAEVASRQPDSPAIVMPDPAGGPDRSVTFAELDRRVDAFAAHVAATLREAGAPATGSVVAVASELTISFAVAYCGVLRSRNVVTPVIPLLPPRGLAHVLGTSKARVAVLTPALWAKVDHLAGELPDLAATVDLDVALDFAADDGRTGRPRLPDPSTPACVQFTSGTTGAPKAAVLSHRNLTVNAFQTADAHELDARSITANHLPTYHPMHLNSALVAGATQVLCAVEDAADAVRMAAARGATHLYSLPVRLARLAGHPELPGLRAPTLRVIASGGSALAPPLADVLARQFGVPVVQGYGLAETSPLTHSDLVAAPRPGSVGPPVADTECRVVAVDAHAPGADEPGAVGEVQVRGPQLMLGYLGAEDSGADDGWFSTGDIGRMDQDGWLYLIDRIKDVFKHDNWLVSPTVVERNLLDRPEVADCCVVDRPDALHGGVAHALLVPAPGVPADALQRAVDAVNEEAPYYERVASYEATALIPRSPQGKVQRARMRARLTEGRPAATPLPRSSREGGPTMVTMVNKFTVFGDTDEFVRVWLSSADFMRTQQGFRGFRLLRSVMDPLVYINVAEWETVEDHQRVLQGADFQTHIKELAALAAPEPNLCTVVAEAQAEAATG